MSKIESIIDEVIKEYNRYRGAEAQAEFIKFEDNLIYIRITGIFINSCGYYDWFDDIVYLLREKGVDAERVKIIEEEDGGIGIYRIKLGSR